MFFSLLFYDLLENSENFTQTLDPIIGHIDYKHILVIWERVKNYSSFLPVSTYCFLFTNHHAPNNLGFKCWVNP